MLTNVIILIAQVWLFALGLYLAVNGQPVLGPVIAILNFVFGAITLSNIIKDL